ncbi:MAG: DUF2905 domain-containing protein [Thermotogae bacterium]|nr:DUF2905 domain-containing protein [Thermotogaceae bacterium]OQX58106.1 MAG: hypothetical protein B5M49_02420 [Thermotoga sp. 4484_232]RKX49921.1 MAG: DUF2905 domain-containing protein [Thermotogota bacterium]
MLMIMGVVLLILGVSLYFFDKIPFLGKLPGDIVVRKKDFVFYFPIVTSIIISVVLTIILNIIARFMK